MSGIGNRYSSTSDSKDLVENERSSKTTNLYVKNFSNQFDESDLCDLFSKYGTIINCAIETDDDGQSKGFGFVNFKTPSMAQHAMEDLNGYSLDNGKKLYVALHKTKTQRKAELNEEYYKSCKNRNLYITNLDKTIDDEQLKEAFAEFGTIRSATILLKRGQSTGCGFVCFSTDDEAAEAMAQMNQKKLGSKLIYVTLAEDKNKRSKSSASLQTCMQPMSAFHQPYQTSPRPPQSGTCFTLLRPPMPSTSFNTYSASAWPSYQPQTSFLPWMINPTSQPFTMPRTSQQPRHWNDDVTSSEENDDD